MQEVTFPIRVMYELGIKTLFVSNAAGGTNPKFEIGDLMIITDQINALPENPLRGKNFPTGPVSRISSEAYNKGLIQQALAIAEEKGIKVQQGVYLATQGPTSKLRLNIKCSAFGAPMRWVCRPYPKSS